MAGQDVEPGERDGTWRIARQVAPARVISVVDPQARHMHKSVSSYRDGYKAHVAVEPETGLVTQAALTPANAADGPTGVALLAGEPAGLEVLADAATGGAPPVRRWPPRGTGRPSSRSRCVQPFPGGFTRDDFTVDLAAGTVTCPAGQTVQVTAARRAVFDWRCAACPLRPRCTRAKDGKTFNLGRYEAELVHARRQATMPAFQASYRRWRPMVERSIAWLVAGRSRRLRYRGVDRNALWLGLRVAAINLRRLLNLGLACTQTGWTLV